MLANSVSPPSAATAWAVSSVAFTGGSAVVVPSMCQLNVPRRYAADDDLAGSRETWKIPGTGSFGFTATSPRRRQNASCLSSSSMRRRNTTTP